MIERKLNRHLAITLDNGQTIDLRPPNVEEWAFIVDVYGAADEAVRLGAAQVDPENAAGAASADAAATVLLARASWGSTDTLAPYASALADTIELLGTAKVDGGKLPMWACRNLFGVLHAHWAQVQVVVEGDPALPAPAPVVAPPWEEAEDPDAPPVMDLDALARVDAPAAQPVVSGLEAGKPTAAAV